MAEALRLLGFGLGLVALTMTITWLVATPRKNAGIVDVTWTFNLGLLAVLYAVLADGALERRVLVGALAGFWALRLGLHLAVRVAGEPEDGRYAALRQEWTGKGLNVDGRFLVFFLFQGLLDVVLSIPYLLACLFRTPGQSGRTAYGDPFGSPGLGAFELTGAALVVLALAGEAVADAQLRKFKASASSRGKTCRVGLWSLSRHPNYFFEWLVWVGFALIALPAPWGFLGLVSPLLIYHFLVNVTGIPATEAHAVKSRGDDYREYQRTTNAFFPWFPKK